MAHVRHVRYQVPDFPYYFWNPSTALKFGDICSLQLFTINGWGTHDNYHDFIEVSLL